MFTDSVASQMQEISFRDQVVFTDYLYKVQALRLKHSFDVFLSCLVNIFICLFLIVNSDVYVMVGDSRRCLIHFVLSFLGAS